MPPRSQTRGMTGHWLLALDLGGRIFRFADQPRSVTRADGSSEWWAAGIEPITLSRSATSAAVTILPSTEVDWAELVQRGADLNAARATLYRWYEGQVLEEAAVAIVGRVEDPEYGAADEPLTISIAVDPWQDSIVVPDPRAVIDGTTWPVQVGFEIDDSAYGASYPLIIGQPGNIGFLGESATPIVPGSPGYLCEITEPVGSIVDLATVMIAGHEVAATQVRLYDLSDGVSETRNVTQTQDLAGRTVSVVSFSSFATVRPQPNHEYWIGWSAGGGLPNRERTGALRGAGELIEYLLTDDLFVSLPNRRRRIVTPIDRGRIAAQRAFLDRFKIDAYINDPTSIWDWIQTHLVSMLPIEWVQGREGGYFQYWRYDAKSTDAVASLDTAIQDIHRRSRVRPAASGANEFTIEFGRGAQGAYFKRYVLTAEPDPSDGRVISSHLCAVGQSRERSRSGGDGVIPWQHRSDVLADDATALEVLRLQALRQVIPPIAATYEVPSEYEYLDRGDVILLSDPELYWSNRVALVRDIHVEDTIALLDLDVLADPLNVARRTS